MSVVGLCRLVRDLERVAGAAAELRADAPAVLARYSLTDVERDAVLDLDARALVGLGLNPLPMRNLLTLSGVRNPEIWTHSVSLRPSPRA
jgi:hypothetical protein